MDSEDSLRIQQYQALHVLLRTRRRELRMRARRHNRQLRAQAMAKTSRKDAAPAAEEFAPLLRSLTDTRRRHRQITAGFLGGGSLDPLRVGLGLNSVLRQTRLLSNSRVGSLGSPGNLLGSTCVGRAAIRALMASGQPGLALNHAVCPPLRSLTASPALSGLAGQTLGRKLFAGSLPSSLDRQLVDAIAAAAKNGSLVRSVSGALGGPGWTDAFRASGLASGRTGQLVGHEAARTFAEALRTVRPFVPELRLGGGLKSPALLAGRDAFRAMAALDSGRLVGGFRTGLHTGNLAGIGSSPWLHVDLPRRLLDAMAVTSFTPPETLIGRLSMEAAQMSDDPLGADAQTDDELVASNPLAAAISVGQDLLMAARQVAVSGAQWLWQEPLWLVPSLLESWPHLTRDERREVRHKAAVAAGNLMAVAACALAGQLVGCVVLATVAYGAVGDLYLLVERLQRQM